MTDDPSFSRTTPECACTESSPELSRRAALSAGVGLASLAVVGCAARLPPVRDVPATGGEVTLALADYPELQQPGGVLPVRPNGSGKPVMIVRGEGDQFSAYSLKCSHLGCTVGWNGEARTFDCPCHGSRYQADGSVLRGPAKRPLTSYAVQADGTTVRFRVG
jgi:cytochrome b6-f complex iron-sulfur subunit